MPRSLLALRNVKAGPPAALPADPEGGLLELGGVGDESLVDALARLEPGQEREELVGGSGLDPARAAMIVVGVVVDSRVLDPRRLEGVVEDLVLRHHEHPAGARLHRGDRAAEGEGRLAGRRVCPHLVLRDGLHIHVEGRVELVAADLPVVLALLLGRAEELELANALDDVVAEPARVVVGRDAAVGGGLELDEVLVHRDGDGLVVLVLRDAAGLEHRVQDDVPSFLVGGEVLGVGEMTVAGLLHDPDEARSLGEGEVLRVDAEVALRRRLDAVGRVAEVRDVQVRGEDLLLRVLLLEADRELHLLDLAVVAARDRLLVRGVALLLGRKLERGLDEGVLDHLHRERRCPRLDASRDGIAERGADDPGHIHPAVLEEAPVLAVDRGIQGVLGDLVVRHLLAVLVVDRRDVHGTCGGVRVDLVALGELADLEVLGQAVEDADRARGRHTGHGDRGGHHDGHEQAGEGAEPEESEDRGEESPTRSILGRHRIKATGSSRAPS